MARTIGKHLPGRLPRGAFVCCCSYCGVPYYRHELRRDAAGLLACQDDYGGDVVTLSEKNSARAAALSGPQAMQDGGNFDPPVTDTPPSVTYPDGVTPQF